VEEMCRLPFLFKVLTFSVRFLSLFSKPDAAPPSSTSRKVAAVKHRALSPLSSPVLPDPHSDPFEVRLNDVARQLVGVPLHPF